MVPSRSAFSPTGPFRVGTSAAGSGPDPPPVRPRRPPLCRRRAAGLHPTIVQTRGPLRPPPPWFRIPCSNRPIGSISPSTAYNPTHSPPAAARTMPPSRLGLDGESPRPDPAIPVERSGPRESLPPSLAPATPSRKRSAFRSKTPQAPTPRRPVPHPHPPRLHHPPFDLFPPPPSSATSRPDSVKPKRAACRKRRYSCPPPP